MTDICIKSSKDAYAAGFKAAMAKSADGNSVGKILSGAADTAGAVKDSLLSALLFGGGVGALAGAGAYAINKRLAGYGSEEEDYNDRIAAMYENKTKEIADSEWLTRVKALREDLRNGYKKMTTEEYAKKYQELIDALDERK